MSTKNNNTTNNNPSRKTHTFKQRIHGFTLVELIVVITILIILGTVAFISIGGYSSNARDSSRISDINNISKGLAISYQKTGYYPDPDNIFNITYSGGVLWTQGTVGSGTMNVINAGGGGFNLSKKPTDPLITTKEYTYSKLAYGNGYQLKADWEGDSVSFFINQAYATNGNPTLAYVKGNFGGLTARTFTGGVNYILAIPSIVTNTGISGTPLEINNNVLSGTLLFNGKTLSGASAFNPKIVVFSGTSLPKDDSTQQITNMMSALKAAYIGTDIATQTTISTLVNTATGQLASLGSSVLSNQMGVSGVGTSGGGNTPSLVSGACIGLPTNMTYYGGVTNYSVTGAVVGTSLTGSYVATPVVNTCQYTCSGLMIDGTTCLTKIVTSTSTNFSDLLTPWNAAPNGTRFYFKLGSIIWGLVKAGTAPDLNQSYVTNWFSLSTRYSNDGGVSFINQTLYDVNGTSYGGGGATFRSGGWYITYGNNCGNGTTDIRMMGNGNLCNNQGSNVGTNWEVYR